MSKRGFQPDPNRVKVDSVLLDYRARFPDVSVAELVKLTMKRGNWSFAYVRARASWLRLYQNERQSK